MQMISAEEKAAMEAKREELYKAQIDVQERIRKAAALGDLSENAEYHFAKEENRAIQRQLAELESKLRHVAVVSNEGVPDDMVFLGHTVKLLDLSDDSETIVRYDGAATSLDEFEQHRAEAHLIAPAARCSIWWERVPRLPNHNIGLIGHFE